MKFVKNFQLLATVAPAAFAQYVKQTAPALRASSMLSASAKNSTSDCPDGKVRCGAMPQWDYDGFCIAVCCDWKTEETCFDEMYTPKSCALTAEGGCPCHEGEVKCGGWNATSYGGFTIPAFPGWCMDEKLCPSTALSDGAQIDPIAMLIYAKGTPEEISSFRNLEMQQMKLLAGDKPPAAEMVTTVERKETELVLAIKHRERDAKGPQANAFTAFVQAMGTPMDVHHFQSLEKELLMREATQANSVEMLAIEREQIKLVRDIKHRKEKRLEKHDLAKNN